ncbi:Crp/Fnr family transcriptional regulator [Brucella sp. NBRC 12950]|uniref:Crp/Fnr family transcriptional regulator n=1 Tax=Brucella sp. NBRC 12950 TaxID=2994518 RepID=UPI0024A43D99|nr:Crp/Fnr family transcriptional regulator [Brucella sp. NBRC 12950]GLU28184.1 transcriptional regulator [Brucella sp. NBRC 12950]
MTIQPLQEFSDNLLLMMLSESDRQKLSPHTMVFDLEALTILHKAGDDVVNTWFPCGPAMASFQRWIDADNSAVEIALIGREGAVGGIVSNGSLPAYATAIVRNSGRFYRIKTAALEQVKLESVALRHWFARYSDCLMAQVFQTAACNATHTITQRTAKWLLAAAARTSSSQFELTHDQLSEMLGVGRTFVTRTIGQLRAEGIITTRRGMVIIEDEVALRKKSCSCTSAIEEHYDAVMHGIYT